MPTENLQREDHTAGWVPSADIINGPPNGLLRMDNCTLDEQGAVALRKGTISVYDQPFPHGEKAVYSIYSTLIDGTKHRYYQVDNSVYHEQGRLLAGVGGSSDVAFGSHLGMVLMGRGNTRKKHDGSQLYNWGINKPANGPKITPVDGDTKVLAIGSETIVAAGSVPQVGKWTCNKTGSSFINAPGHDGGLTDAIFYVPDPANRAPRLSYLFPALTDLSGIDEDTISFYVNLASLADVQRVMLLVDVGDGTFQTDYYYFDFLNLITGISRDQFLVVGQNPGDVSQRDTYLDGSYDTEGWNRRDVMSRRERRGSPASLISAGQYTRVTVTRGQMIRVGSGKNLDWRTASGVQVALDGVFTAGLAFDTINMKIGKLNGKYSAKYCYVRTFPHYQAKSGPSPLGFNLTKNEIGGKFVKSEDVSVEAGFMKVKVDASPDGQVDDIWIYLMGGALDSFYLAHKVGGNVGGEYLIDDKSERDLLEENDTMESFIDTTPTGIIGIAGPWFDRVFALTPTLLWPSKQIDIDAFDPQQALQLGDGTQLNYWVAKTIFGLYIGNSKDIYRVDGDGSEYPDGTINFRITPMNQGHPPINGCVAQSGNTIVYVAGDGPRAFNGVTSTPFWQGVDLLWKGYTRYGVGPVDRTGRMRAAFGQGEMVKIILQEIDPLGGMRIDEFKAIPSGDMTDADRFRYATFGFNLAASSPRGRTLHCYDHEKQRWYRHLYPHKVLSIFRELDDGTLLHGDDAGNVWIMDHGNVQADEVRAGLSGKPIEFTILTKLDDNGKSLNRKDPYDLQVHVDTADAAVSVYMYSDEEDAPDKTVDAQGDLQTLFRIPTPTLTPFIRFGLGIIGSAAATLKWWGFNLAYRPRPQIAVYRDTGYVDVSQGESTWIRQAWLKVWCGSKVTKIVVTPYFDGVAYMPLVQTVPVPGEVNRIRFPMPRNYKGRQPRLVIQSINPTGTMRIDEFPVEPHGGGLDDDDRTRYPSFGFDPGQRAWSDYAFEVYWVRFRWAAAGDETEKQQHLVNMP